jgi:GAF domain-containing protein
MLKNRGVRSVCALPLTTVHRRLGGLAVGSTQADAYSGEEVSFLSLVANQVALALDRVELRRVTTCPGGPARERRKFSPGRP